MDDIDFEELIDDLRENFLEQTRYTLDAWLFDYFQVKDYGLIRRVMTVIADLDPELFEKLKSYFNDKGGWLGKY